MTNLRAMDIAIHNVKKVKTKIKRLSNSGTQVVTLYIETEDKFEGFNHEIILFAGDDDIDLSEVVRL